MVLCIPSLEMKRSKYWISHRHCRKNRIRAKRMSNRNYSSLIRTKANHLRVRLSFKAVKNKMKLQPIALRNKNQKKSYFLLTIFICPITLCSSSLNLWGLRVFNWKHSSMVKSFLKESLRSSTELTLKLSLGEIFNHSNWSFVIFKCPAKSGATLGSTFHGRFSKLSFKLS